ncbi:MAG: esterase/lipase family protein [Bacilli bacterium]
MFKRVIIIMAINILSISIFLNEVFMVNNIIFLILNLLLFLMFILLNIIPIKKNVDSIGIYVLSSGCSLLRTFLLSLFVTILIHIFIVFCIVFFDISISYYTFASGVGFAIIGNVIIFWNGIIRVYLTSVQLGINKRILGIILGWILGFNIYYLGSIIKTCENEVELETQKLELNQVRVENEICKTKYPIVMVHGVFFRDFRYLNYWGRIPQELIRNGATIYYGNQESAASVEECGLQLSNRIKEITNETGCEKVNIIAHSKGGLDSRTAISNFGAAPYVASLTTINTPHYGCIFSEFLLNKISKKSMNMLAVAYNTALKKFGDKSPDFIAAATDLSKSVCEDRNKKVLNAEGILYESVMSYCNSAVSGKFPLNLSYSFVKYFDGKNDGLVSVESAKWGSRFILLDPHGKRGISHGDMIDLNRENIKGFDVREFYVELINGLKMRGY